MTGLPKGVRFTPITIPADQAEFAIPLRLSYQENPADAKVKLKASLATADTKPSAVESAEFLVAISPGEKPAADPPLAVFDENADFVKQLTQGGGVASLSDDAHTGKIAAQVTPDQRYNEKMPGLGINIRENPGPGEYRFLRFAWKKHGGAAICLQLNHDGAWGPGGGAREGAKFRYHAGGGPECFGASVAINKELPNDYVVVTRDLFQDFGEFRLDGIALSPIDGKHALFDGIYLGRSVESFDLISVEQGPARPDDSKTQAP